MKTSSQQTKNNEFYYRIVEEDCEKCGAGKEVLYKYNNNGEREVAGFICHICGNKKKPPKIELPKVEKKIINCHKCGKQSETGIFAPPTCWNDWLLAKRVSGGSR